MYALVLLICYLDGGCEDIMLGVYDDEPACIVARDEQRLRHAGCYPVEDVIDGSWTPACQYSDLFRY